MEVFRQRFRVTGVVQGVGFRFSVREFASAAGITGTVANLPDGSVEVIAEGNSVQLEAMTEYLNHGPRFAHVEQVSASSRMTVPREYRRFSIIR